ncbi:MAG: HAD-IA family hydrolase [Rectinemataceae bacterium]
MIAAVLFDMDGVLVDSERLIAESARRMFLERYGLIVQYEDFTPFVGAGENRYLGGVAERYGLTIDIAQAKAWTYEIYGELARRHEAGMREIPGAVAYVRMCRQHGLKVALCSAADRAKVLINLEYLGLLPDEFDVMLTAEDVTHKKPDPEMYRTAAARLGLPSDRCLVVEDAINGVLAGIRAGSPVLGLTTTFTEQELMQSGALWCAPDLAHAPAPWDVVLPEAQS